MAVVGNLSVREVVGSMTLEIRVTRRREMATRLWIGMKLLLLAARVIGTQLEISFDKESTRADGSERLLKAVRDQ